MRGLPWGCRKNMVLEFFNELPIRHYDILFTHLQGGRPSGEALVCFPTASEYNKAHSCAGKFMEGRYIELFPATTDDVAETVFFSYTFFETRKRSTKILEVP